MADTPNSNTTQLYFVALFSQITIILFKGHDYNGQKNHQITLIKLEFSLSFSVSLKKPPTN